VQIFGWFEDENSIYLAMEFFQLGDLGQCKSTIKSEGEVRSISRQINLGLVHMHDLGIIHRDINPRVVLSTL
jgi:serine/threonine protein kinase